MANGWQAQWQSTPDEEARNMQLAISVTVRHAIRLAGLSSMCQSHILQSPTRVWLLIMLLHVVCSHVALVYSSLSFFLPRTIVPFPSTGTTSSLVALLPCSPCSPPAWGTFPAFGLRSITFAPCKPGLAQVCSSISWPPFAAGIQLFEKE